MRKYAVLFIVLACVISRLPMMLGPNFFLNGDECVVALMTRATLEGEDFSLYFWGQQYGMTFF